MKDISHHILNMLMFKGITEKQLIPMLKCLGSRVQDFKKGEFIYLDRDNITCIGIILSGTVQMIKEDIWGDKTILVVMKTGELFGETFACGTSLAATVTFYAPENTQVLFLPFYKVLHLCDRNCQFHHQLVENMVTLIARKNAQLMEKADVTSKKTLRKKILTFLSHEAQHHQDKHFTIAISRTELAEYLSADRTALARELNHMKEEGLIDVNRNSFTIF